MKSYLRRGLDEASLFSECEGGKRNKHVLNGAIMVPLVVTTLQTGSFCSGLLAEPG